MPFKSNKQRRYLWANEPEIARDWTDRYGARGGGIMSWADQGGMKNYLGEQPMVNAPQNWRSGPDSPPTELAYITQPEKELILRSNIHGSLQNGPNEGPSGIMSLDSQGDYTRDRSPTAAEGTAAGAGSGRIGQERHDAHMRNILTGQQNIGQTSAVSERTRRGAVPEWVERPDGTMAHVGSAYKDTGRRGFLSKLFGGANKYGYGQTYGTGSGRFFDRKPNYSLIGSPGRQRYVATDPRIGQLKPGYGGRILGGLASLATGIPFVGSTIGSAIDKYKPKSYWDKLPDSEKRRLNALNITPWNEQKLTAPNVPMDSLSLQNFYNDPLTRKLSGKDFINGDQSISASGHKPRSFMENLQSKFGSEVRPAAAVKPDFLKQQSWYNSPLKLRQNTFSTALGENAQEKMQAFQELKSLVPRGTLTVEKYLDLAQQNKIPSIIAEDMNKQVLEAIKEQGGFGDTFPKNYSFGNIEPTIEDGRIDIDETKIDDDYKDRLKYLEVAEGGLANLWPR